MDSRAPARDLSHWVAFDGHHPPKLLNCLFWGTIATYTLPLLLELGYHGRSVLAGADPDPGLPLALGSLLAVLVAATLWPLLPWHPLASWRAKARTVLFLGATLVLIALGSVVFSLFFAAVAIGNAVVVTGGVGAIAYTGTAVLMAFTLHILSPNQTVRGALLETVLLGLICAAMVLVFAALEEARRKARQTSEVLDELRDAHAELRRYADRARELTLAEERARMAREMHDTVGHYLTVINMGLVNAQRFRVARPEEAWQEVREAQELTQEALADTRRWVRALKPLRMEGRTGVAALAALAESFAGTGVEVGFTIGGEAPELDEHTELICFRALQEGCTNALRHSGATRVRATLSRDGSMAVLAVRDNGNGAAPDAAGNGFGLRGLRERAEAAGGTLTAGTHPEGGFELRVSVPIRPPTPQGMAREAGVEA